MNFHRHTLGRIPTVLAALAAGVPMAALGQTSDPVEASAIEEIVVSGYRGSVERSAEIKRNADQVVDAISAEELGKLPDQNIAEGLQRITGVQIDRDGGEGNGYQIRGSDNNLTLVNGRQVAPDADGGLEPAPARQVNLFNFPAEMFSEILVFKSPTASQIEGGIGGVVNLRMPSPLDTDPSIVASAELGYFDLSEETQPRGVLVLTQRNEDATLGGLLGVTYYKRNVVTGHYDGNGFQSRSTDITGDGNPEADVYLPSHMRYMYFESERERLSIDGKLEWQATDAFRAYLEGSYVDQEIDFERAFSGFLLNAVNTTGNDIVARTEADGSTTLLAAELSNVNVLQDALAQNESRQIYSAALGGIWDIGELSTLSAELATSSSDVQLDLTVYQVNQPGATAYIDLRTEAPSAVIRVGANQDDPAAYLSRVIAPFTITNDPDLLQSRVDFERALDWSVLNNFSAGVRYTDQTFNNDRAQTRYVTNTPAGSALPLTDFPQYIGYFDNEDFFAGAGGDYPTRFVITPVGASPEDGRELLAAFGDDEPYAQDYLSSFEVQEETLAGYLQLDYDVEFAGKALTGNIGVRVVETDITSLGNAIDNNGVVTPITITNSYTDVLPSFNAKLEFNDGFLVRVSLAEVMARPNIVDLSAGTSVRFASGLNEATGGNPLLDPFRATQFDIGAEYYFDSAGVVSLTYFHKDIESFITIEQTPDVTLPGFPGDTFFLQQPVNGPGGYSKGFELGYQQTFDFLPGAFSGLGVIANYTYIDSEQDGVDLPLPNVSDDSYNLVGFYEIGGFQTRLAYNWRSERYVGSRLGSPEYLDSRGQLDMSASFDLSDNFTLTFEGLNLLQDAQEGYAGLPGRINLYEVDDRRLFVGVRAYF